jgi:peptidoglycan/LPS O-acetylase OafA/YrhL
MADPVPAGLAPLSTAGSPDYRPEIDGLRALAIAPVVLFHVGFSVFRGGFVGVDVFFVISGYLITGILQRSLKARRFSLIRFYERRARRILPALIVVSAAIAWLSYRLLPPRELIDAAQSLVWVSLFASNIYFYLHSGYWEAAAREHPLLHTWSLGVEEQFYIIFPLALWALDRRLGPRATRLALVLLGAVSLMLSLWAATNAPQAGFYLLPFRAFELMIGGALAYGSVAAPRRRWAREALAAGGVALIVTAVAAYSQATPFPGLAALVPCLGAAMVIHAGAGGPSAVAAAIGSAPLRFVGRISYSLYLWHWPLIVFAGLWLGRPFSLAEKLALVLAAIGAATFSWLLVERPFREGGRLGKSPVLAGLAVSVVAAAGLGAHQAQVKHGWPNRLPPFVNQIDAAERPNMGDGVCFLPRETPPSAWKADRCLIEGRSPERVLLWGDSFAAQYRPALEQSRGELPFSILQYTYAGCPPVFGFRPPIAPRCDAFNGEVFKITAANQVRTVVLAARWSAAQEAGMRLSALTQTVRALQARGLTVVVVGQSPVFAGNAARIFAWRRLRDTARSPAEPVVLPPDLNDRLRVASAGARFVDPMAALCEGELCRLGQDRTPYFIDEGHLSVAGAKVTLRLLVGPIAGAVRAAPMGAQTLAETRAKGASAASRSILSSR